MFGGVFALGSVSALNACETLPVEPALAVRERPREGDHGEHDQREQHRPAAGGGASSDGARRSVRKPIATPTIVSASEHRDHERAELVARGRAFGERDAFGAERVPGEVPGAHDRPRRAPPSDQQRGAAQAQRHDAEPQAERRPRSATSAPRE